MTTTKTTRKAGASRSPSPAPDPKTPGTIEIRTDLLAAVAKWAHHDSHRPIGAVVFRDDTITATDGHRLVVAPHPTNGQAFGVSRNHLLAAAAAQDLLAREGMDPKVDHDVVETPTGDVTLTDGPRGDRTIELWSDGASVAIRIGELQIIAPIVDHRTFPTIGQIENVISQGDNSPSPDGYLLDARFLAAIEEVNTASTNYQSGIRVIRWSRLAGKERGPIVLRNVAGVRFVIMPQRDEGEAK